MVTADGVNALLALAPTAWLVGMTVGFVPPLLAGRAAPNADSLTKAPSEGAT
jgi:hypothetical protein